MNTKCAVFRCVLELGPRDMENGVCVLVSRVTVRRKSLNRINLVEEVQAMLEQIHQEMFDRAQAIP